MDIGSAVWVAFVVFLEISVLGYVLIRVARKPRLRVKFRPRGRVVEAEIVGRFEADAPAGSEVAKARQPYMASWDPYELELRYSLDGREITSRGRVSFETFFRSRAMSTLPVAISPEDREKWTPLD